VKLHPDRGRELLSELGGFDESVRRLVLDHHERLDGTGYPRGLAGDHLDLGTRILSVCDVYDALVSARVYRPAWTREQALELLRGESGVAFDERCVSALEDVLNAGGVSASHEAPPAFVAQPVS
jgi:HD-GYP domain-containing protein (c-di-GMP phosphodiesterase class II)